MGKKPAPMVEDFALQIEAETIYVNCNEQEVHGFVVFYPRGDHVHLENLAVCPEVQKQGIGARLVHFVEDAAKHSGCNIIELYTNENMTENFAFYRRLGYQEIGRWEEDGFNRVFYRKEFLPARPKP
jgi:ribosomal protein S18 acetylase RimI-like enzyme